MISYVLMTEIMKWVSALSVRVHQYRTIRIGQIQAVDGALLPFPYGTPRRVGSAKRERTLFERTIQSGLLLRCEEVAQKKDDHAEGADQDDGQAGGLAVETQLAQGQGSGQKTIRRGLPGKQG